MRYEGRTDGNGRWWITVSNWSNPMIFNVSKAVHDYIAEQGMGGVRDYRRKSIEKWLASIQDTLNRE